MVRFKNQRSHFHMIAGNIEIYFCLPRYGFGVAAATLVGQNNGAKRFEDAFRYGLLTDRRGRSLYVFCRNSYVYFCTICGKLVYGPERCHWIAFLELHLAARIAPVMIGANPISPYQLLKYKPNTIMITPIEILLICCAFPTLHMIWDTPLLKLLGNLLWQHV